MRKVPADVLIESTTPWLCAPTTVDRFICGDDFKAGTRASGGGVTLHPTHATVSPPAHA